MKLIAGQLPGEPSGECALEDVVGKTIVAIYKTEVEGAFGEEPCIKLVFDDNTEHGFVLPSDNWDED